MRIAWIIRKERRIDHMVYMTNGVALRNDDGELIAYYEKHEYRDKESMKMYDLK